MVDEGTKKTLSSIPLLKTKAGPREKELWVQRLKEEYMSLIQVKCLIEKQSIVANICLIAVCAKQQVRRQRLVQIGIK